MPHGQVKVFAIVVALGGDVGTDPGVSLLCPGRAVTDSINQLITMCTQQAPGQKECDNALRELEVRTGEFCLAGCWDVWGGERSSSSVPQEAGESKKERREQGVRCGEHRPFPLT